MTGVKLQDLPAPERASLVKTIRAMFVEHVDALAAALHAANARGLARCDLVVVLVFTGPCAMEDLPPVIGVHRARAASAAAATLGDFPLLKEPTPPGFLRCMCWLGEGAARDPYLFDITTANLDRGLAHAPRQWGPEATS